jgi:N-ethylmaleimide reductase
MIDNIWKKNVQLGNLLLRNPVVMAPLTRMRALPNGTPGPLASVYYRQRASAGLIITEATQISSMGQGYPCTPGIYLPEHVQAWKQIVDGVHEEGGLIVVQLWHVGRISHSSFHPKEGRPWAPSAIAPKGKTMTADWSMVEYEEPIPMTIDNIHQLINQYKVAAQSALEAGFDGIEIHSANGYLLDQFLQDGSNHRDDLYGGSIENRSRLLFEVIDAVMEVYPSSRVGVRLSPFGTFNDMSDSDSTALFQFIIKKLTGYELAYVHLIEARATAAGGSDKLNEKLPSSLDLFAHLVESSIITAGGYQRDTGASVLEEGHAQAVAFGRYFISNPDLPERLAQGWTLADYHRETFYGGDDKGYIDYEFYHSKSKG